MALRRSGVTCSSAGSDVGKSASLFAYARRKIAEGTFDRPDVAEAIASRRSQLIFGFYDKRARKVPDDIRLQLLAKSGGICARCARPFTPDGDARFTVQHSTSESGVTLGRGAIAAIWRIPFPCLQY